jgi:hypothetical protein
MSLDTTHRIRGFYQSNEINQDIIISREQVKIEYQSTAFEGEATIAIRYRPQPRLEIDVSSISLGASLELWNATTVKIAFCARNLTAEGYVSALETKDGRIHLVARLVNLPAITALDQSLSGVVFHVLNFYNFIAPTDISITNDRGSFRSGRAIIELEEWRITVDAVENIKELSQSLRSKGGFAITHTGCLVSRKDNQFKPEEAENVLTALHCFLSFCRGSWVDVILPVGVNDNGESCWEEWRLRQQEQWETRVSWFDEHHGGLLGQVFPGFWQLWKDEVWRDPVRTVIYWYVRSSNPRTGTDGAIVLTQAGLEQLAWVLLVEHLKALSIDGFEKLPAADQIRLLLSTLKIPTPIPSELIELAKLGKEYNWDGPAAFTEIRNSIVHPGKMEKQKQKLRGSRLPITDAWTLGLWYIELALLSLFHHKGVYARRLQLPHIPGTVANVPWCAVNP